MTRAQQREVATLLIQARKASDRDLSTLTVTSHCGEVLMEHLANEGLELSRDYSAEERRRMARAGHAMPDGSFPIANCHDAAEATLAIGHARQRDRDAVASHIYRRVLALDC